MKLVSYLNDGRDQLAFLVDGLLFDCDLLHPELPNSMNMFLNYWDDMYPIAQQVEAAIKSGRISKEQGLPIHDIELLAPVPSYLLQRWICLSPTCSSRTQKQESRYDS